VLLGLGESVAVWYIRGLRGLDPRPENEESAREAAGVGTARYMAIKKSELYSSLWASCDELRGGMDASQYKDYVLVLLFIKYVSDKYVDQPYAPIAIPSGASFKDLVKLKGDAHIGDKINKRIIGPLAEKNGLSDMPDFNDASKLGGGKEMVDRLTNLIAIFEDKALDFSKNRAEGDDILGDAYEYLMRHFATESGKSKGQFYTPAEVSRVIAQILGIRAAKTTPQTTAYDPTCGSGSLLLKLADEATTRLTLYGQEKDATTSGLARMNMILHDNPGALIAQGNTLARPEWEEHGNLKTFDFVVANPPFSDKRWNTGLHPNEGGKPLEPGATPPTDYGRFEGFGVPPAKQGDFAYLLHIVRSLKSTGKGACILPHGVLFRGNAEAAIRKNLVKKGYIKGIVGLPPNLFYGTGIPACIVVLDKEHAHARKGIFLVDASAGFTKDGPKNRLRAQDIHRIVDIFTRQVDVPGYSRMVPVEEIEKNDFNLNLPRYIDSQAAADLQDIEGHLRGGIPERDVEGLKEYWEVCPGLKSTLFKKVRAGYVELAVEKTAIRAVVHEHTEFRAFVADMNAHFDVWRKRATRTLKALESGFHPKQVIGDLSEGLLKHYYGKALVDAYTVYQHLMDYWAETMQDDEYLVALDGWKARTERVLVKNNRGKEVDKGWACDLVPKPLIVTRYFAKEQVAIDEMIASRESLKSQIDALEEEQGGEEGAFAELEKVTLASVRTRLKELAKDGGELSEDELATLEQYLSLCTQEAALGKQIADAEKKLDAAAYAKYPKLADAEVRALVVDDKWLATLDLRIHSETDRISQKITSRVSELAERYATRLPLLSAKVEELEAKVSGHLERMGFGG
jgi:type I restriction enzyme M protein